MSSLETGFPGAEFRSGLSAKRAHQGLQRALTACQSAEQNALLWFAEILRRQLYRELGHSSIQAYATEALGFSPSKTSQFVRLSEALEVLPILRAALSRGEISWTSAREILRVATPATERAWVDRGKRLSRRALAARVTLAKEQARRDRRRDPAQGQLGEALAQEAASGGLTQDASSLAARAAQAAPAAAAGSLAPGALIASLGVGTGAPASWGPCSQASSVAPVAASDFMPAPLQPPEAAPPCAVTFRMDGIQLARFDALMALARRRGLKRSRTDLLLEALAAFIEESPRSNGSETVPMEPSCTRVKSAAENSLGVSAQVNARPAQIILYQCKSCGRAEVVTSQGRRVVSPSTLERIACDAIVQAPGQRNRSTIPPATRQAVLARDGHRCQVRGCGRTQGLEVHHVIPRSQGGSNKPENLVVACSACHQLLHEKGLASPLLRPPADRMEKDRAGLLLPQPSAPR